MMPPFSPQYTPCCIAVHKDLHDLPCLDDLVTSPDGSEDVRDRQTDVRQQHRLMPLRRGAGHNNV